MAGPEPLGFDIAQVLERFPRDAAHISRLVVEKEAFRHLCEDYILARFALARLERLQETREPSEVTEYRTLVSELEKEIAEALRNEVQSH
jgi:hypothetical protein